MNTARLYAAVCAALVSVLPSAAAMKLAANTWVNADFSQDQPFLDLMLMARGWNIVEFDDPGGCNSIFGYKDNYPWSCRNTEGVVMPVDQHGWPLQVPFTVNGKQYRPASAMLAAQHPDSYPAGEYVLLFEGTGEIVLAWDFAENFDARITVTGTGGRTRHPFTLDKPGYDGKSRSAMLGIVRSEAADHIRNIHIVPVEHESDFQTRIWRDRFIDDLRPYGCIRFMDWCQANWTTVRTWENRVEPLDFPQTGGFAKSPHAGMAYEYMIHLANVTQKDMWLCMPPEADDAYQTKVAEMVRDRLDPNLKCYIEWANETWNGMFWSSGYAASQAASVGLQRWCYHGYAAAKLFHNFDEVFGANSTRIVKVLSGQDASTGVLGCILEAFNNPSLNTWGSKAHAIATAPYFGGSSPDTSYLQAHKTMAQGNGLDFICYEGGNKSGTYDNYKAALGVFDDYVSLFNQYTAVNEEWGAKKFTGQSIDQAGAYRALLEYAEANNGVDRHAPLFVKECAPWWLAESSARVPPPPSQAPAATHPGVGFDPARRTLSVSIPGAAQPYVLRLFRADGSVALCAGGRGAGTVTVPASEAGGVYVAQVRHGSSSFSTGIVVR